MALPDPRTVALAREYLRLVGRGRSPQQAISQLNQSFPQASAARVAAAFNLATRATDTGQRIADLPPTATLRSALGGYQPPQPTVGVQVVITYSVQGGPPTTASTVLSMDWNDTKGDVTAAAVNWITEQGGHYEGADNVTVKVVGGALFAP